jgi:hypothetical protein
MTVFLLSSVLIAPVSADERGITHLEVAGKEGAIIVSAVLEGGFSQEIAQEIRQGVSREFFYYIVLHRVIPHWYDEEKRSKTLRYSVKYDFLKNQFRVNLRDGNESKEAVFDNYEEMKRWVSHLSAVSLAPVRALSGNHEYYVSVKAEMKAGELPVIVRYVMFFVPYSRFHTPWVTSRIFRVSDLK